MKLIITSLLLAFGMTAAIASDFQAMPNSKLNQATILPDLTSALTPRPEAKGRKGSTRVGGSNSKGKGSRYVGGRK